MTVSTTAAWLNELISLYLIIYTHTNMKQNKLYTCVLSLALLAGILSSCQDEDTFGAKTPAQMPITLSGEIEQLAISRVNDNGFCDGDEMGVYIVDYEGNTPGILQNTGNRGTNVKHTFDEAAYKWNSAYDIYWKDDHTPIDIYGYYQPLTYNEFYKSTFHDYEDPARTVSFHAEGTLEYDALLFVPGRAPFDLYSRDYEKGLALYSSNVLIMDKCAELLPDYYNFVRGVVDSADVSLNISRETLQHDRQLRAIARRVEKKITSELEDMRDNDRETYETFFENFGRGLKYGIYSSYGSKADELADLLLFWSAREKKMVTLREYAEAMPEGQKAIYYAAGDDRDRLSKMPVVTGVLARGYDVLLLTADVDEFTFQSMREYVARDMPKVYEDEAARDDRPPEGITRVIVAKNRSGPIGDVDLVFLPASTKFYELNEHAEE